MPALGHTLSRSGIAVDYDSHGSCGWHYARSADEPIRCRFRPQVKIPIGAALDETQAGAV